MVPTRGPDAYYSYGAGYGYGYGATTAVAAENQDAAAATLLDQSPADDEYSPTASDTDLETRAARPARRRSENPSAPVS